MARLVQPIEVTNPDAERSDPADVISVEAFIKLLKEEEDYWQPEQENTKLMITRLRKIFYDQWGWNSELIRGAAKIETRYQTVMKQTASPHAREITAFQGLIYTPIYRQITYTNHDKVYGSKRAGQVPYIYQHDHQEVKLNTGDFCDIAHVLAGLDALNFKQVVTPLPSFLSFFYKFFPYVDSNADVVTWIGDIASSSADFLFDYIKQGKKRLNDTAEQKVIDEDASGADMLGDIDPYVIAHHYAISASRSQRISDILADYYFGDNDFRKMRYLTFAELVGLKEWDGNSFSNEKQWLKYYAKQLRNCICFVVFSQNKKSLRALLLPLTIWMGGYKDILKINDLLIIFLNALKEEIKRNSAA